MSALEFIRWIPKWPDWTKVLPFVFVYFAFCYVVKIWSDGDQNLLLSNYVQFVSNISSETLTPVVPSASQNSTTLTSSPPLLSPPPSPSPPPRPMIERFGILNENGTMKDMFELGNFYDEGVIKLGNWSEAVEMSVGGEGASAAGVNRFLQCVESMMDYIPCMDNADAIERLPSTARGGKFERHCPEKDKGLNCLVPKPKGYKSPTPWPKSRDEVWFDNIPNAQVAKEEQGQFWLSDNKDMIHFTGRGPKSIDGADEYTDHISQMVPEIAFGRRTRVVLDVGSGVASFGAYLMSRNVLTLSIGLKDVHRNEIQLALERGVPAMVATFTTRRLSYPSQAFDMIHCACSQCVKNWTLEDGIWLLEVNRMLRAGRYFVWADPKLNEQWKEMEDLTTRLCWVLLKKEKSIAIWQKPLNNSCYLSRQEGIRPPLCHTDDDPDNVWYINL